MLYRETHIHKEDEEEKEICLRDVNAVIYITKLRGEKLKQTNGCGDENITNKTYKHTTRKHT